MRHSPRSVALLLFGSGLCALVYQVAWQREFRLIFGASTAASAAVLAIFVAGLGAGSLRLGSLADRHPLPLRLYARLEAGIALGAALTPFLLDFVRWLYFAAGGSPLLGPGLGTLVRLLLASLVLLAPTFLMGGTLPAAARAVEAERDRARSRVALLYGLNTLGAVTGAFAATFFAFELLGTRRTLWLACLLNLLVALAARSLPGAPAEPGDDEPRDAADPASPPAAPRSFVLAAATVVGAVYFLMELVWYRMLGPLLGGTVFSFGLILALALLGIGLGGALYALVGERRPGGPLAFATTCVLEAALLAVPLALGDRIALLALQLQPLATLGFGGSLLGWSLVTALVVLPPSLVAGFQFPLLVALLGRGRAAVGRDVGWAYAANTLGAVAGSLAGGFGLLPLLSAPGAWRASVACLLALALGAVVIGRKGLPVGRLVTPGLLAALALALVAQPGPSAGWRHSGIGAGRARAAALRSPNDVEDWLRRNRRELVWEVDGTESSVALTTAQGLAFVINGKIDGHSTVDASTQVMSGLLPVLLRPLSSPRALVIGLGTGSTAGWLAAVPGMQRVDVVELEPAVLEVARAMHAVNRRVLEAPNVHITLGDAREVLLASRERYSLIFSEPSNPYRAGIASLFTDEYYAAVSARLAPGGVFVQWVQAYEVDPDTVRSVYATLLRRFGSVETWRTEHDLLLLATQAAAPPIAIEELRRRVAQEPFASALRDTWRTTDAEGVLAHHLAGPDVARALAAGAWINTDDLNRIEFGFARTLGRSGLFDMWSLAEEADALGQARAAVTGRVDWQVVQEDRAAASPANRLRRGLPEEAQARLGALELALGDPRAALAAWGAQSRPPERLRELLLMGSALAEARGSTELDPVARQLAALRPLEADALRSVALFRGGHAQEALLAMERTFRGARQDPWFFPFAVQRALFAATELARAVPASAQRLLEELRQPFAADTLGSDRRSARVTIASRLPLDARCVEALTQVEPHVPWKAEILAFRARCYASALDPRAGLAAAELERFVAAEPRSLADALRRRAP